MASLLLRDCVSLSAWMDAAAAAEQLWPSYTTFSLLGSPHIRGTWSAPWSPTLQCQHQYTASSDRQ